MQATFAERKDVRSRRVSAPSRAAGARRSLDEAGATAGLPPFMSGTRSGQADRKAGLSSGSAAAAVDEAQSTGSEPSGSWLSRAAATVEDWFGDITDTRPDEARLDALEDLSAFMAQDYHLANHHPATGRGLFDADYAPRTGEMVVTLKLCFRFVAGDPTNAAWIAAVGGPAAAAAYTPDQFVWQPGEAEDWKANAITDVQDAWSDRYTFHNTRPYWETLPDVHVRVHVVETPAAEAHFVTTVRKWPKDGGPRDAVTPPAAGSNQSTAQLEESADNGITVPDRDRYRTRTTDQVAYGLVTAANPGRIFFDLASAVVQPPDRARLHAFGAALGRADMPPFPVTVTGHASSEGPEDYNLRLSEDRARAVSNEIVEGGAQQQPTIVAEGERGAAATAAWRVVEITVGDFTSEQETVVHEFGHMLGLGDEYPNPPSRPVGAPVAHSALAVSLIPGQQPIVATDNESIMSTGSEIRPYHYVTFLEALGIMTGTTGQWAVGPASPRGPGDFPLPTPGGSRAA